MMTKLPCVPFGIFRERAQVRLHLHCGAAAGSDKVHQLREEVVHSILPRGGRLNAPMACC